MVLKACYCTFPKSLTQRVSLPAAADCEQVTQEPFRLVSEYHGSFLHTMLIGTKAAEGVGQKVWVGDWLHWRYILMMTRSDLSRVF